MENNSFFNANTAKWYEETVSEIEKVNSYNKLLQIQKMFEQSYEQLCNGKFYYTARKNSTFTKIIVTLENGLPVAEICCNGNFDTLSSEEEKQFVEMFKKFMEETMTFLNKKVAAAKIEEDKSEKSMKFYGIVAFIVSILVLAIVFFDNI